MSRNFGQCRNCGKPVVVLTAMTASRKKIPTLYDVAGGKHLCAGMTNPNQSFNATKRTFKPK